MSYTPDPNYLARWRIYESKIGDDARIRGRIARRLERGRWERRRCCQDGHALRSEAVACAGMLCDELNGEEAS